MGSDCRDGNWIDGYRHMPDAPFSITPPVTGTKNLVLATTPNAKILSIHVKITWTVQPLIEVHVTIDGNTIIHTWASMPSATDYFCIYNPESAETDQGFDATAVNALATQPLYEGKRVKGEVESTGGTVSALECRVKYSKK